MYVTKFERTINKTECFYFKKTLTEESTSLSPATIPRRLYEHRNSLLPNDPGLNGAGSNPHIDRRNSNESDESDNLSQYFRSSQSRKSSLFTANESPSLSHGEGSDRQQSSSTTLNDEAAAIASRRLQSFLQTSTENRISSVSMDGGESQKSAITRDRKSSTAAGSFKFLKKKTKSIDLPNQVCACLYC